MITADKLVTQLRESQRMLIGIQTYNHIECIVCTGMIASLVKGNTKVLDDINRELGDCTGG